MSTRFPSIHTRRECPSPLDFPRPRFSFSLSLSFFPFFSFSTGKRVESIHVNNRRVVRKYRVPSQIITVLKGSARSTRDRVPTTSPSLNDQANHVALCRVINRFGRWCVHGFSHKMADYPRVDYFLFTIPIPSTNYHESSIFFTLFLFFFPFFFFNETRYIYTRYRIDFNHAWGVIK